MLKVKNLNKSYGKKKVLSECNFTLEPYQIMGVFGHNGCGKTTLFRLITGILKPDSGVIEIGHTLLGYMPEQRALLVDLTLNQQATFLCRLKGLSPTTVEMKVLDLATSFGFSQSIDVPLKTLSKGNQQKAQLILAMIHEPNCLILDEPFNGLDYHSQRELARMIRTYSQKGNCVLISSHQLEHMDGLCDEILILDKGITIKQGHLESIRNKECLYSLRVNADSNWKDLQLAYASLIAQDNWIEYRFSTLALAKKAMGCLLKEKSVQSLHLDSVVLSELIA